MTFIRSLRWMQRLGVAYLAPKGMKFDDKKFLVFSFSPSTTKAWPDRLMGENESLGTGLLPSKTVHLATALVAVFYGDRDHK